ncbi:MAG: hypothetical protein C4300_07275, partial [Thermus sp.]
EHHQEAVDKVKEVPVKVGKTFETRKLHLLGSQIKQEIKDRLKDNLRSLAQLKAKSLRVGKLKFKPFVNSIPLKQYGVTYGLDLERNRVRIQRLGSFRVLGLHQIPPGAEMANAFKVRPSGVTLVRKPSGYYLHVVVYVPRDGGANPGLEHPQPEEQLKPIGIDLGIKHQLTLSNGLQFQYEVPVSKRVKRLQRILSRKKKGSKNYEHTRYRLRRAYEDRTRSWPSSSATPPSSFRMTR